ncbi:MAG: cytochrome ubiquinol oxidase subunit I [Desulfocapsaceae bacterium]|nr:cytochrome ubiquinol oxidase subunit I [Desulfocapsaceae bacterium]
MTAIDLTMVKWAQAQFALTAMYHWLFVPLTLGLSFIVAFMETIYVRTGDERWRAITKFWMTLFGINFAIGIATGIILEFEFGTNWSKYSWMVGDIFGAPLAIEGIVAFFLEATFFAVMFFGWDRVSKGFHLFSTWMVAVGSNLSALWILVANSWMQYPVGMNFNPDSARFEMQNFWEILSSPVVIAKFTHTTVSSFIVASLFVITVASWYLLKGRHVEMAKKSVIIASVFGLLSTGMTALTGDQSAVVNAETQPMKLASYEGLYKGTTNAGIVAIGLLNHDKEPGDNSDPFRFEIKIPGLLSLLAKHDTNAFIPGIEDLLWGNEEQNIMGVDAKMKRGQQAITDLAGYKEAVKNGSSDEAELYLTRFEVNQDYLGYGYLTKPEDVVPPVETTFYSFHIMVILAGFFLLVFLAFLYYSMKDNLEQKKLVLRAGLVSFFLAMIASQAGWIVAEVGRQPWIIQDMMPIHVGASNISAGSVQTTFFMFAITFTLLLLAEITIMVKQIKKGPRGE